MTDPAKRIMWTSQSTDDAMLDRIRSKSEAARCLSVAIHGIHPDVAAIVHDEIRRYKVSGPMSITFVLSHHSGMVTVNLLTVDRDNQSRDIEFSRSENIATWLRFHVGADRPSAGISDHHAVEIRRAVQDLLFRLARDAYLHELGEWFTRDGVRVRDPHADEEP